MGAPGTAERERNGERRGGMEEGCTTRGDNGAIGKAERLIMCAEAHHHLWRCHKVAPELGSTN